MGGQMERSSFQLEMGRPNGAPNWIALFLPPLQVPHQTHRPISLYIPHFHPYSTVAPKRPLTSPTYRTNFTARPIHKVYLNPSHDEVITVPLIYSSGLYKLSSPFGPLRGRLTSPVPAPSPLRRLHTQLPLGLPAQRRLQLPLDPHPLPLASHLP